MSDDLTALANEVRIACQRVSRRVRYESGTDLPPHLLSILYLLGRGPRTPGELAEQERVSAPGMSKAVSVLQGRGLVERRDDPTDGRRCLVTLTEAGRQALDDGRAERDSFMVQRITSLSADEREVLRRAAEILQKVIAR